MADIQWIKIAVDIFDNRKIRQIESMPEGESVLLIWLKLICLAGSVNDGGNIYLTKEIPYTNEMLATHFNKPLSTIKLALTTFQHFGMIEIINDVIQLSNWGKYQDTNRLAEIREQNRLRKQAQREREKEGKLLSSRDSHVTPCDNHATEEEEDIDLSISKDIDKDMCKTANSLACPYQEIIDLFNNICVSLPKVRGVSNKRKQAIKARWVELKQDLSTFKELFEKVEQTDFLKGKNDRDWMATFDWLMKSDNITKVLEGNYDKRGGQQDELRKRATGILPKPEKGSFSECRNLI